MDDDSYSDNNSYDTGDNTYSGDSLGPSDDGGYTVGNWDYQTNDDVGVAPTSPVAQEAIDNWNADRDAWSDAYGDVMDGLPSGFFSDAADFFSRHGIMSQTGAGQRGLLDDVNWGNLAGGIAGLYGGPLAGIGVNALISGLTKGEDAFSNTLGRGGLGFLGGALANEVAPGLGPLGSMLGTRGFDYLSTLPTNDPINADPTNPVNSDTTQQSVAYGSPNPSNNQNNDSSYNESLGGAALGFLAGGSGSSLGQNAFGPSMFNGSGFASGQGGGSGSGGFFNNYFGTNNMATTGTTSGANSLAQGISSLFPYLYSGMDNDAQTDYENSLGGLQNYQGLLQQSYTNPEAIYNTSYRPIDEMFNQELRAQDAAQGRTTDAYKRGTAREANFYKYLQGMQGNLGNLAYGQTFNNLLNSSVNAGQQQSANQGAMYNQLANMLFGNSNTAQQGQTGTGGSSSGSSGVVGGVLSGDYYDTIQDWFGGDTSTGFWEDIGSWFS